MTRANVCLRTSSRLRVVLTLGVKTPIVKWKDYLIIIFIFFFSAIHYVFKTPPSPRILFSSIDTVAAMQHSTIPNRKFRIKLILSEMSYDRRFFCFVHKPIRTSLYNYCVFNATVASGFEKSRACNNFISEVNNNACYLFGI